MMRSTNLLTYLVMAVHVCTVFFSFETLLVFVATSAAGVVPGSVSFVSWKDVRWPDWLCISAADLSEPSAES